MDITNGAIEGQQQRVVAAVRVPRNELPLAGGEQTVTASDRDLTHGVDGLAHEFSRDVRRRSARQRTHSAAGRLQIASRRDASADARDVMALARDQAATARDLAMTQRDAALAHEDLPSVTGAETVARAADLRRRAAQERRQAAENRALAADDRLLALRDREQAARDRSRSLADRDALARQLAIAETDVLTGARTRAAGLIDLDHEVDRCRRNSGQLVVSYIDVVGLKALNDSQGHDAGDRLLKRVVTLIRSQLRSYDLIIRLGGDEFLCAMADMTLSEARQRFDQVAAMLATSCERGAIRSGFAQLADGESATQLIMRADHQLLDRPRA